jgi:hypothetical protein
MASSKTCFVIMPIGTQSFGDAELTANELRLKYDDLIKEAISRARPTVDIVRADDVSLPGTITTDIITRIMHSDYVVADVTYPNPNVFYELGLRHACKTGTIIIRDKSGPKIPFDIAHLRCIDYENTPTGLKELANQLGVYFDHADRDPNRPDNHFQELAKLTGYEFPDYKKPEEINPEIQAMMGLMQSPELLGLIMRQQSGEAVSEMELISAVMSNPQVAQPLLQAMSKSGDLSFSTKPKSTSKRRR